METVQAHFEKAIYAAPHSTWNICTYVDGDGNRFTAKGTNLPKTKYIPIIMTGDWKEGKGKYKSQRDFEVKSYRLGIPHGERETIAYLTALDCCINTDEAQQIWDKYGEGTLTMCRNAPEKVRVFAQWVQADVLQEKLNAVFSGQELADLLAPMALSTEQMRNVSKALSIERIKENPYALSGIPGVSFDAADKLALGMGFERQDKKRVCAVLWHICSSICGAKGHTYWPKDELIRLTLSSLHEKSTPVWVKNIELCISTFVQCGKLVEDGTAVYTASAFQQEQDLAREIAKLLAGKVKIPSRKRIEATIAAYQKQEDIQLADMQKAAVVMALTHPFSIITGGAGTGKTTVIRCVLYCLEKLNLSRQIRLMAPTGRAARRMTEATSMSAETIHHAVGICGDGSTCSTLDADTAILDEASMLDQNIALELLSSLELNTRVIFLGDSNQLPSVGAGNVLREMIASNAIPTVKLETVFRQDDLSPIVANSIAIEEGDASRLQICKEFQFWEIADLDVLKEKVVDYYLRCVQAYGVDNVVLLNPYRRRKSSKLNVEDLNAELQERINPRKEGDPYLRSNGREFRLQDRVMQTRNQPSGVANGDVGEIIDFATKEAPDGSPQLCAMIDFGGIEETYTIEDMASVQLAYCSTVHKSQGAEYNAVIMIVHSSHKLMLTRNLVYTAVTRAKRGVVIFGEKSALNAAIENDIVERRNTKLASHIREAVNGKEKEHGEIDLSLRSDGKLKDSTRVNGTVQLPGARDTEPDSSTAKAGTGESGRSECAEIQDRAAG